MTRHLAVCCIIAFWLPAIAAGQSVSEPAGELLSLETALRIAVENNRSLEAARLQVQKAEDDLAATRTRRFPSLETTLSGSQLLTPVSFAFPAGSFGDYPGIGPIPAVDSEVTTPRRPSVYATAQMTQPLTQLKRIGLSVRSAEASRDLERERARDQQLSLVNAVKRVYFGILQVESALAANDEAIALYKELGRTLDVRVAQRVALKSDALDVDFRLAQEELTRLQNANNLATQKEQLNQLLGRPVATPFAAETVTAISPLEIDLVAARARALEDRPDVREARVKVQQAELDRRLKHAERIPDVSLAVSYLSNFNMDVLPQNLASAGVQLKWEPFDWGRKGRELASKDRVIDQARLNVREVEDKAVVEINTQFRKLGEARALLNVAQLGQNTTREKLRVRTNQYQIQAALLSDVLQLRAELADTNDQYQQALLAFWTAKADFELAVGEEVIR